MYRVNAGRTNWQNYFSQLGFGDGKFDDEGFLELMIDGRYQVLCFIDNAQLTLTTRIGLLSAEPEQYDYLLSQVLQQATQSAYERKEVPVLDSDMRTLLLQRSFDKETPIDLFQTFFFEFLNVADVWRDWFKLTSRAQGRLSIRM
ncbi:CesT family type III secretion system chaperone [Glaciimonas sp. GG7]